MNGITHVHACMQLPLQYILHVDDPIPIMKYQMYDTMTDSISLTLSYKINTNHTYGLLLQAST